MAQKAIKKKSYFITIEGSEGSGKSSIIKFISSYLRKRGNSVKIYREPGSTKVGEKIRKILLDKKNSNLSVHTELLLYLAARTQLIEERLAGDFKKYDFIICDRFFDSTLVYQGYALGLGKVAQRGVEIFSLGLKPNLTLVLDAPVKEGLARLKTKDRIESRSLVFHKKLRKGYLLLAKKNPKRIKIINARGSLEHIKPRVEKALDRALLKS